MNSSFGNGFLIPKKDKTSGSNIKSIQYGASGISGLYSSLTISSVDLTKSVAILLGCSGYSGSPDGNLFSSISILDSTTLQIARGLSSNSITCSWCVVEFNNVKSLQKGSSHITASTATVSISKVNLTKSLLFCSFRTSANPLYSLMLPYWRFYSDSALYFSSAGVPDYTVEWQVIEFY